MIPTYIEHYVFIDYIDEASTMGSKSNIWWLVVGLSGILGTISRAMIYFLFGDLVFISSHFATIIVNISGSFLLSFATSLSLTQTSRFLLYRDPMLIGFTGSFTTFSMMTYNLQTLLIGSFYLVASVFLVSQLILGLISIRVGKKLSRYVRSNESETPDMPLKETL
ncbi:MAG: fluoride efflux transporter FluC [Candidatus Thorarchaeota archaeon]